MISSSRYRGLWLLAWPAMLGLFVPACSEELPRPASPLARVSGKVMEGNRPIGGGWIEFVPVERTVGRLRSAPIAPDGSFSVEGVGVGPNNIGLVDIPSTIPGARRLFDTLGTSIRRDIGPQGDPTLTINLYDEFARYQALTNRGR